MKAYIVYATNRIVNDKSYIQLFGRLENGKSFSSIHDYENYVFMEKSDAEKQKSVLTKFKIHETNKKTFDGKEIVKVTAVTQSDLDKIIKVLEAKSIKTYEADLKPHQKFLIDHNILTTLEIKGETEPVELVDVFYRNPSISSVEFTPKLKVVSIDIETDKKHGELYCIGIYTEKEKHCFVVTNKKSPGLIACKTESECLEKFKQKIIEIDPDIITGWNVIDFDFNFLKSAFERNNLPFNLGRDNSETRIRIESSFFRNSSVNISGRQVLDGLNLIKDPFIKEAPTIRNSEFESWSLEDVSQALLGQGKLLKGKGRHDEISDLYKKDQEKLAEYNLQDCKLAYDLLEKTKILELAIERTQLTGMTLDRLTASIAAFDSLYIREAHLHNLVSPSLKYQKKEERIKGGYVMESNPGIYHNVIVLDFKSLYPSIIKTFNIDPASFTNSKEKNTVESPNKAHFKNQDGVLPIIIERLHQAREKAKLEKRELASYAIKIIMNSFFGVLASPNCRYFSLDIANAITHFGQHIVKLTADKIREHKLEIIYSDTDSIFINTKKESQEALILGHELPKEINEFYQEHIRKKYNRKSYLELEFKKHYLAFMIPKIRNQEKGSKKRYAGLVEKDGEEETEIVGLEAIRGDWTDAAQEFQRELLSKVFHRKEFIPFIKTYVKNLRAGKMDEKLIYSKSIRKGLEEYTKTTPPHVKAARLLDVLESNVIKYYITTKGPEPIQKLKHEIDYDHYIDKQIAPIANTILAFFDTNFEDVMKESKQTKLFS